MRDQILIKEQVMNETNIPLDEYSQAEWISELTWVNRYGRAVSEIIPSTVAGRRINELPVNHFGSVRDYDIDTLPLSYVRCKGTEITWISSRAKEFEGKYMINRRFLSKILQKWCYLLDISFKNPSRRYAVTGISLWTKPFCVSDINHGEVREINLITGEDGLYMLRDFLFLMRNQDSSSIFKKIATSKVSSQLWGALMDVAMTDRKKFQILLEKIKNRLNYDYQVRNIAWGFSKWNPEMIEGYISELNSGSYILDMGIPVIHELWKYPVRCTDVGTIRDMMDYLDEKVFIYERE